MIEEGKYDDINEWLKKKVYAHGKRYSCWLRL
jgi:Zn-dependent M32 family carboxypeptidase